MAVSTCAKCNNVRFEIKEAEPANSEYKIIFVQCVSCGTVVGTMPYFDAGILAKDNQKQITAMKNQLNSIESMLSQTAQYLQRK